MQQCMRSGTGGKEEEEKARSEIRNRRNGSRMYFVGGPDRLTASRSAAGWELKRKGFFGLVGNSGPAPAQDGTALSGGDH